MRLSTKKFVLGVAVIILWYAYGSDMAAADFWLERLRQKIGPPDESPDFS